MIALAAGPVSGWLAERAFGWTAFTGAVTLLATSPWWRCVSRAPPCATECRGLDGGATTASDRARLVVDVVGDIVLFLVFLVPSFQIPLYFHQRDALRFSPSFIGMLRALGGAGVLLGAAAYGVACRYLRLRTSLVLGVGPQRRRHPALPSLRLGALGMIVDFSFGAIGTMSLVPVYDLATRATPKGSESFAFGLMMSVRNVAFTRSRTTSAPCSTSTTGFVPSSGSAPFHSGRAAVRPVPAARSPRHPRAGGGAAG